MNIDQSGLLKRFAETGPGTHRAMTIGASIFLVVVGAILYFATNPHLAHVDIDIVGLILMIAGAAGLVLGFVQQSMASRRSRRDITIEDRREPTDSGY